MAFSLLFAACSTPRDATPLPEPPAMVDVTKVSPAGAQLVSEGDDGGVPLGSELKGAQGAAPAGSLVQITDLDSALDPILTTARSDGSFLANVPAESGDVLRFEAIDIDGNGRTPPTDGVVSAEPGAPLSRAERHACLSLEPGFSLDLTGKDTGSIELRNQCTAVIQIANARFRTQGSDFMLATPLPTEIPARGALTLEVSHQPAAGAAGEVVLFVDVTLAGTTLRYPLTLYANAR